ncbi:hypothetical protein [Mycolicibacterium sp. OfavD-34-C]|uniref:hypothetical protein n=1 Tax=Mycolicibacterium sp. OfavD-34-C TaxID=2917746 RepID=UPI001EF4C1E1|nr:hypothetical protein [Mycolicibacterium sp. OfavD-34-C]MCG7578809.1 hypothetical protein [Mycolicibacterium sp. OfavD-34-C]
MTNFVLDGQNADDCIDGDYLRLNGSETHWETAEIVLEASTEESPPTYLTDVGAYVLVNCAATQVRRSFSMTPLSNSTGFQARIMIPRTDVTQKATISVEVVASFGDRRRVVGSAIDWTLAVEVGEAPSAASAPPLSSTWIDFTAGDAPSEVRQNPTSYCYVDMTKSPPLLYLNSGIDGFQSLIMADNAKTERRRHRDLLGATVARRVATTLIRAAVDEVTPGEYGAPASGPTSGLLKNICEAVAGELPDTESVDDLFERITSLAGNPNAAAQFWSEVDLALDRMTGLSDVIVRTCGEVKHA